MHDPWADAKRACWLEDEQQRRHAEDDERRRKKLIAERHKPVDPWEPLAELYAEDPEQFDVEWDRQVKRGR